MDTNLTHLTAMVERIDERTERIDDWIDKHEKQNRDDFKEVHSRVNRVERKQNWTLGVLSMAGFAITATIAWAKDFF